MKGAINFDLHAFSFNINKNLCFYKKHKNVKNQSSQAIEVKAYSDFTELSK